MTPSPVVSIFYMNPFLIAFFVLLFVVRGVVWVIGA